MSLLPRRRPFASLRRLARAATRPPSLAPIIALVGGALVILLARPVGGLEAGAVAASGPRWVTVTVRPDDWPAGEAPTYRRLLSYYGLESALLPATLAANMTDDRCPNPDAPIALGASVRLALSRAGGRACATAAPPEPT